MLTVGGINVEHELNGEERCSTLAHQCQYQYFVCKWSNTHCPVEKAAGCIFRKPWIGNLVAIMNKSICLNGSIHNSTKLLRIAENSC